MEHTTPVTRFVLACFSDASSLDAIRIRSQEAEVVAVACDLCDDAPLIALRDAALAAGAVRCHVLDVREEFLREALLPALRSRVFADPFAACAVMARDFVTRKLREIARLEHGEVVVPDGIPVPRVSSVPAAAAPLNFRIGFAQGLPVSINGVEMSLTELLQSVETITGEPALTVLQREYDARQPTLG